MKTYARTHLHRLERIVKGFDNHRRIEMMLLLEQEPNLSLSDVSKRLNINIKTAAEHLRRLAAAGMIIKGHQGVAVQHTLTNRGVTVLVFLKKLE